LSLCLDTNVAVELIRARQPHLRQRLLEAERAGENIYLSVISLHELIYGARASGRPEHQVSMVERFTAGLLVADWSAADAIEAGQIRAELKMRGTPIGDLDVLIAGQARNRGWTVITANVREFARIDGLQIIDWSDPAGVIDVTGAMARLRRPSKD
jgi:tRNA(fMet)-specific endonuclease VapC